MLGTYLGKPIVADDFDNLTEADFEKIDGLARLMQKPDENFDELMKIWETDKDFRLLTGSLL